MPTSRRDFLALSTGAGMAVGFGVRTDSRADDSPKPLRLLILGGTGFIGPHQVRYALGRGHKVAVFNRGKTHPGELPEGVEQLIGDRNGQLDALKGRQWDVVIDNPTTLPAWVRDAAEILKGNVDRYVFISTISVYADNSKPGADENSPMEKYPGADPMRETLKTLTDSKGALYGPLKALSEQEAQKQFPGQALIIRPGLIVGPGDETDRFTYWPVRVDQSGTILAPGTPDDPVQFIDARDLAEWTVRMAERRETGVYNATGPEKTLTMGAMLDGIKEVLHAQAQFVWADAAFLEAHAVHGWSDLPVWLPPSGETAGFTSRSIRRALDKGLAFRSLGDTTAATLAWFKSQGLERQAKLRTGLTPEREKEVLAAWDAREQKS